MTISDPPPALGPWAEGRSKTRALVIVNEGAGSVGPGAREKLLTALAGYGIAAIQTVSDVSKLSAKAAKGMDVIVVLGGDGTARLAAEMFTDGAPLILLPGGTLNVLPHALYGQLDWPHALDAALTGGRVLRLPGGEANGKKFFVAAMFGAPTLLAHAREAARHWRLGQALSRLRHTFRRSMSRSLAVRPEGGAASRAEAVGVLCPAYSGEVEGQMLEWVRLDAARISDFVRLGLRAVVGGWRDDPTIELSLTRRGEIRSRGFIPAILDGEPTSAFVSRVRIRMLIKGPKVIALDDHARTASL